MEALIIAQNQRQEPTPQMQGMGISLAREEGDKYGVVATFGNVGDVYLDPSCRGGMTNDAGTRIVKTFDLTREPGLVLTLNMPRFGGTIDFAGVDPGVYIIRASVEFGTEQTQQTLPVQVSDGEEGKVVEVIELAKEGEGETEE